MSQTFPESQQYEFMTQQDWVELVSQEDPPYPIPPFMNMALDMFPETLDDLSGGGELPNILPANDTGMFSCNDFLPSLIFFF